jgi:hypothetical protein
VVGYFEFGTLANVRMVRAELETEGVLAISIMKLGAVGRAKTTLGTVDLERPVNHLNAHLGPSLPLIVTAVGTISPRPEPPWPPRPPRPLPRPPRPDPP